MTNTHITEIAASDPSMDALYEAASTFDVPTTPFVPPAQRQRSAPRVGLRAATPLLEVVEEWHSILASPAIDTAADELREAVKVANTAAKALRRVSTDRADELKRAQSAARAGDDAAERIDWQLETARRKGAWSRAHAAAAKAQRHYLAIVSSEAPQRIDALRVEAQKRREKAAKALARVEADVRAAADATQAIRKYGQVTGVLGPRSLWRSPDGEAPTTLGHSVRRALEAVEVIEADPVLNGDYLDDPTPSVVPDVTRRALWTQAETSERAGVQLSAIEAAEESIDQRRSRYTAAHYRGDPKAVLASIAAGQLP